MVHNYILAPFVPFQPCIITRLHVNECTKVQKYRDSAHAQNVYLTYVRAHINCSVQTTLPEALHIALTGTVRMPVLPHAVTSGALLGFPLLYIHQTDPG